MYKSIIIEIEPEAVLNPVEKTHNTSLIANSEVEFQGQTYDLRGEVFLKKGLSEGIEIKGLDDLLFSLSDESNATRFHNVLDHVNYVIDAGSSFDKLSDVEAFNLNNPQKRYWFENNLKRALKQNEGYALISHPKALTSSSGFSRDSFYEKKVEDGAAILYGTALILK